MKKLSLLGTAVLCTIFLGCSAGSSSPDYSALLTNTENQTPQSSTPSKPSESTLPLFKFSGDENYVSAKNVSASDAENQSTGLEADWWKKTSFYHVWVKSFSDSDGDGCGDLNGVKQKLDYIQNEIGCDGIRVDAARYLIEDDGKYYDTEGSHTWFKELRKELDKYASPKFMMCEVWGPDHEVEESYLGNGTDEFHMTLDFHQGSDCIKSVSYQRNFIKNTLYPNKSETTGFATFMVNHDEYNNRIATTFKGDQKLQKLATALSLLRPTVPIIYYGTEIGLKNTSSGGDSALRGNFDWSLAEEQMTTEKSLLKLNNAINSFRKTHASSFADADVKHLTASITSTAAYIISGKKDNTKFLCVYNLSSKACDSADFTGCNSFSSSSCIMGDTEAPELSLSGTTVSVKKIAPFSFRVYALDATETNIWDDETYTANENYEPADEEPNVQKNYSVMYIRGNMNNWGGTQMTLLKDGKTFSYESSFYDGSNSSASKVTIIFKFCENNGTTWGDNWGTEKTSSNKDGNFIITLDANVTYVITFNPYTNTMNCNKK